MIDPTPNEKAAFVNGGRMGGEYLDSIDKTDLETLEPDEWLFGLYEGVPLIERGILADQVLPDKISIFQGPLQEACASEEEVRREVRTTVVHEIAHHFGIDEARLAELGYE